MFLEFGGRVLEFGDEAAIFVLDEGVGESIGGAEDHEEDDHRGSRHS